MIFLALNIRNRPTNDITFYEMDRKHADDDGNMCDAVSLYRCICFILWHFAILTTKTVIDIIG